MNRMQFQVTEFHLALEQPVESEPMMLTPERRELRMSLIMEEARELNDALQEGDMVGAADAIADLLYVTFGTAVEMGIDMEPVFDEVHRSNMDKVGGPTRGDGKVLKPPGWQGPDVAGVLGEQGWSMRGD